MSRQLPNSTSDILSMEINGTPYYVASNEGVPYLYDVDTREEVGYWSSKKGQYIMFSLYNKMMKKKYENLNNSSEYTDDLETVQPESDSDSNSGSHEETEDSGSESDSGQDSGSRKEENEESESDSGSDSGSDSESQEDIQFKKNNTIFKFTFLILFVYLTLQKEFQSIYFDFIFLICINLLNTFKVFEMLDEMFNEYA
jgi:hypothetical protein